MSGPLIELIFFGAIAFIVIGKLISILGNNANEESFFGEGKNAMKDVTNSTKKAGSKAQIIKPSFAKSLGLKNIIVEGAESEVKSGLEDVIKRMSNFNIHNFINNAKSAFMMIISASEKNDAEELDGLVDKRYMTQFQSISSSYGKITSENKKPSALISEIYMFGNNIFIKLLFTGKNITQNVSDLQEEWTFTKSVLNKGPEWHLTNIDRVQ